MKKRFIPVNDLLAKTTLKDYIDFYGFQTEIKRTGQEERIQSPFPCEKCRGNGLALSVNWPSGVFTSHCYHCSIRGRVTTLLYGLKYNKQPSANPLKGEEFKDIAGDIASVAGYDSDQQVQQKSAAKPAEPVVAQPKRKINLPLLKNDDERIRALENLDQQFVFELDEMNARAGAYIAQRPYMTPDMMQKWGVGVLPSKSKSMLRGRMVYCLRNEKGEKIGWAGRDLAFDEKFRKWENSDRKKAAPEKTKFPPGLARGSFLYGAEIERLEQEGVREQIQETGLIVCEGFNEVIALDSHGIVALAICSNNVSEGQVEKLVRWSKELSNGRITLFLDNDEQGEAGTQQMIQKLADKVHVKTAWKPDSCAGEFRNKQPEDLSQENLTKLLKIYD